jgi:hypothetical protein
MSSEGAWTGFEQQAGLPARFPESVEDAMEQAGDAVLAALDDGIARVRIQLRMPEFNPMEMPMEQGCVVSFLNSCECVIDECLVLLSGEKFHHISFHQPQTRATVGRHQDC